MDNKVDKINSKIAKLKKRREELFKLRKPIDKELTSSYEKIEKLKEDLDKLVLDNMEGIDWAFLLNADNGMQSYKAFEKELGKFDLYGPNGTIKNKRCFQIMLTKNSKESLDKVLKGLNILLPYLDYNDFGKGYKHYKYVDIFEHTLSQWGSWYCLIDEEKNEYLLMCDRYHRTYKEKEFSTLKDLIVYIQENHYYE